MKSYQRKPAAAQRNPSQNTAPPQSMSNQALLEIMRRNTAPKTEPLPGALRGNMERLSGVDLSDVTVTYQSVAPLENDAVAQTTGTHIHLAPGEENSLPHEAWHAVQQLRGSVPAQGGGSFAVNESPTLEAEADRMGDAARMGAPVPPVWASPGMEATLAAPAAPVTQFRRGKPSKSMFGFMRNQLFGSKNERKGQEQLQNGTWRDNPMPYLMPTETKFETQDVNMDNGIRGKKYTPKDGIERNGKVVVMYSGTHGTNEQQLRIMANQYCGMGYIVYGCDYRGFGESGGDNFKPTEKSIYDDGTTIYNAVKANEQKSDSDIVLHGYSMGGSVASRVAADVADRSNANPNDPTQKLGGLVMHSAMPDVYTGAKKQGVNKLFARLGQWNAGKFSSKKHLKDIARNDPDMPVHFMGGGGGDHLSPDNTSLFNTPGLAKKDKDVGEGGHMGEGGDRASMHRGHITGGLINKLRGLISRRNN